MFGSNKTFMRWRQWPVQQLEQFKKQSLRPSFRGLRIKTEPPFGTALTPTEISSGRWRENSLLQRKRRKRRHWKFFKIFGDIRNSAISGKLPKIWWFRRLRGGDWLDTCNKAKQKFMAEGIGNRTRGKHEQVMANSRIVVYSKNRTQSAASPQDHRG